MRRFGLPVLPLIVGTILGPLFERHLRRSLQTTGGDPSGLVGGPVAWACYALILGILVWPVLARLRNRRRNGSGGGGDGAAGDGGPPPGAEADRASALTEGSTS